MFFYKKISNENPPILFKNFTDKNNDSLTITKVIRSNISYLITETNSKLKICDLTFYSFYSKFYSKLNFFFSNRNINLFKKKLILSINDNINIFVENFPSFDLNLKFSCYNFKIIKYKFFILFLFL